MSTTARSVQRKILKAIQSLGAGWHDRASIAKQLGKNFLNPAEVVMLEMLVETGKLERAMQPTKRRHIMKSTYKINE